MHVSRYFLQPGIKRMALTALFVWLCSTAGWTQLSQPARFEKVFKYSDNSFTLIPMKEEGMVLLRDLDKHEGGKKQWEIIVLDTDLKEVKTLTIGAETRNRLIGYDQSPGQLFLLFRQGETEKSNLELVRIDLRTDGEVRYMLKPELTLNITHFSKAGNGIVLGGYVNKEPAVLLYDMTNDYMKVLPGFFQKDTELVDLRVNQNNTFNVILIERALRDEQEVVFQTYDETGKLLLEDKTTIDRNITLQTGITSMLEREDLMLLGTWGEGNSRLSNGFYALPVDPFSKQKINYVAHGELEHFLDYQKAARANRIKEKTKEELKAGGIPNFTNYVMPYRVAEYPQGFLLLAEVYNPASSNLNNYPNPYNPYYYGSMYSPYGWYYPGYGRLYPRPYSYNTNNRTSDNSKTYESALISFSPSGKVQWDVSVNLDEIKQSSMEQVVDFHYFDSQVVLLYKKESDLVSKWIDLDSQETEEKEEKVKLNDPADEIRSEKEYEGGVRHWYGNAFYAWGFQTIKNVTHEDRVRDVFYINKVVVE